MDTLSGCVRSRCGSPGVTCLAVQWMLSKAGDLFWRPLDVCKNAYKYRRNVSIRKGSCFAIYLLTGPILFGSSKSLPRPRLGAGFGPRSYRMKFYNRVRAVEARAAKRSSAQWHAAAGREATERAVRAGTVPIFGACRRAVPTTLKTTHPLHKKGRGLVVRV